MFVKGAGESYGIINKFDKICVSCYCGFDFPLSYHFSSIIASIHDINN